ncbi:RNA-binding motif protein, X-linked 2 isoform X2 [Rhincodon typus]|uniref:RNA-binding motif protein, X-linked 2 isoform X2 n=1 Tax=Rhincodon typus TaxID=259920 RepID=UPI0009A32063|nr:RNA-binding motif protein, X-linked 2 isoform X2 [Rhincodon typus]
MNPLTKVKLINELNAREVELGVQDKVSWHSEYKDSAWIFLGGLPYELTEGDIICVFSQYGEIVNINLVRDKKTGKSKGFCFICYEDQRSTILAVDNFNGIKIKGRTIRVDHVANYRPPNDGADVDAVTKRLREEGCAPKAPPSASDSSESSEEDVSSVPAKKQKKEKKKKKKRGKKEKKVKVKKEAASKQLIKNSGRNQSPPPPVRIKREREDVGYDKYAKTNQDIHRDGSVDHRNEERGKGDGRKHTNGADEMRTREKHRERSRTRNSEREERRKGDQNGRGSGNERSERDVRHTHGDGRELRYDEERHSEQEKMRKENRIDSKNDDHDKYRKYSRSKRDEWDSHCDSIKHKESRFEHDKVSLNKGKYNYRDSDQKRN